MDITSVRSLERGLDLVDVIAAHDGLSLAQLHRLTGLAKSTIRRLLQTLVARSVIRRSIGDDCYRANVCLTGRPIDPMDMQLGQVATIAGGAMADFTRQFGWPLDLHAPAGGDMKIYESTRRLSPHRRWRQVMSKVVPIPSSAAGRLYLSALPQAERTSLLRQLEDRSLFPPSSFGLTAQSLDQVVAEVSRRGYGVRIPEDYGGFSSEPEAIALSLPLIHEDRTFVSLAVTWDTRFMGVDAFYARFQKPLLAMIADIRVCLRERRCKMSQMAPLAG